MSPAAKLGSALIAGCLALAILGSAYVYREVAKAKAEVERTGEPVVVNTDQYGGN